MVDTGDSKSPARKGVRVRVPPSVPAISETEVLSPVVQTSTVSDPQDVSDPGSDTAEKLSPQRHTVIYLVPQLLHHCEAALALHANKIGFPSPYEPIICDGGRRVPRTLALFPRQRRQLQQYDQVHRALSRLLQAEANGLISPLAIVPVLPQSGNPPGYQRMRQPFRQPLLLSRYQQMLVGGSSQIQLAPPIFSASLVDCSDRSQQIRRINRIARHRLKQLYRLHIGPLQRNNSNISRLLETGPRISAYMSSELEKHTHTIGKLRKQLRRHIKSVHISHIGLIHRLLLFIFNTYMRWAFPDIKIYGGKEFLATAQNNQTVLVPCHRSNLDGPLMRYAMTGLMGLAPPAIFSGNNLDFRLFGRITRSSGIVFIQRTSGKDLMYISVLQDYIRYMLLNGYSMMYFIEGGRSRTGHLLRPMLGLLRLTLENTPRNTRYPVTFIPVNITYENLLERSGYIQELKDESKLKTSMFNLVSSIFKLIFKRQSRVHISLGTPIDPQQNAVDDRDEEWSRPAIQALAQQLLTRINHCAVITPVHLIATVFLATPRLVADRETLLVQIGLLRDMLMQLPTWNRLQITPETPEQIIATALQREDIRSLDDDFFSIGENEAVLMTYYRNNISHLLAIPGLIATLVQFPTSRSQLDRELARFYPLVRNELMLPWDEDDLTMTIDAHLGLLEKMHLVSVDGNRIEPSSGSSPLSRMEMLRSVAHPLLERYYLCLILAHTAGRRKELMNRCQQMARRISRLLSINPTAYFETHAFDACLSECLNRELIQQREGVLETAPSADPLLETLRQVLPAGFIRSVDVLMRH